MKKMTKFFALALLAGAMVSCSTEDIAPSTQNDKVAVQFTGGISVSTRAAGVAWADGDKIGIFMTGANQPLSADAIKEGVDNVCYLDSDIMSLINKMMQSKRVLTMFAISQMEV